MIEKNFFLYVLSLLLLSACMGDGRQEVVKNMPMFAPNDVKVIDIDKAKPVDRLFFSSLFDAPDVVVLETKDECLLQNIRSIELYRNNIYLLDERTNGLYVFDMHGNYRHRIGQAGNGPGEYIEISDFSIDRERGVICLWDRALHAVHIYDLNTRKFQASQKVADAGVASNSMVYLHNRFYIEGNVASGEKPAWLLKEIDASTGQLCGVGLPATDYNKGWNYPVRLPQSCFYSKHSNTPKFVGLFSDTIVSITPHGLFPSYVVKSKDFVSAADVKSLSDYYQVHGHSDFTSVYEAGKIHSLSRIVEVAGMVSFEYYKGEDRFYLFHDTLTDETQITEFFINDYVSEQQIFPMPLCYSDDEWVVSVLQTEYIPPFRSMIVDKALLNVGIDEYEALKLLADDANPVLFFHKAKIDR